MALRFVGSGARELVWLEEKSCSRPGVAEQVRNGVKGVKTNLLWLFQLPPERYGEGREGQ